MPATSQMTALVERVRGALIGTPMSEKRMFGGITFLYNGNMLCCASNKGLMVRVGKDAEPRALAMPSASNCLGTGRPMAGFIMVEHDGLAADKALSNWLEMALGYVGTLPAKKEKRLAKSTKLAKTTKRKT